MAIAEDVVALRDAIKWVADCGLPPTDGVGVRADRLTRVLDALEKRTEALEFYAALSPYQGSHACDVDVRFQIDGGDIARAALEEK